MIVTEINAELDGNPDASYVLHRRADCSDTPLQAWVLQSEGQSPATVIYENLAMPIPSGLVVPAAGASTSKPTLVRVRLSARTGT